MKCRKWTLRLGIVPPEGKLDKEFSGNCSFVGVSNGLCIEENTNFTGFGIRDNRIDKIFSPEECQSKCQSR